MLELAGRRWVSAHSRANLCPMSVLIARKALPQLKFAIRGPCVYSRALPPLPRLPHFPVMMTPPPLPRLQPMIIIPHPCPDSNR
jgi:hypothetical protein